MKEYAQFFAACVVGGSIFGLFSSYAWHLGTLWGAAFSAVMFPMAKFERRRGLAKRVARLRDALSMNRVYITEINATAYASFQEFEDLGALYVFQVESDKLFVLRGQDYCETPRFPSLRFEIVNIPSALFVVRSLGPKANPSIEFDDKTMLGFGAIDDQIVLNGKVSDVLRVLRENLA